MLLRATVAGLLAVAALPGSGCGGDDSDDKKKKDAGAEAGDGSAGSDGGDASTNAYSACSTDGWCWEVPKPQGNTLRGSWAKDENDIWAVGDHGTALHYDGKGWAGVATGTNEDLNAVWASGASDLYAVGNEGTLLHYDGKKFSPVALDVGAEAGADAGITTDFYGVYGSSDKSVWVVGEGGAIWHFDGSKWATSTNPSPITLYAVWASSDGQAWAVGETGVVLHYDGIEWKQVGQSGVRMNAIHGCDATLIFTGSENGVIHYATDGITFNLSGSATAAVRAIHCESTNRAWAFGQDGTTFRYEPVDGAPAWSSLPSPTTDTLYAAAGLGGAVLTVGESGTMVRWEGDARAVLSSGSSKNRLAIGGSSETDVWAAGDEVVHDDGSGWEAVDTGSDRALYDLYVAGKDDVWAVGTGGTVLHYTGAAGGWSPVETASKEWLRGIAVTPTGGWTVGTKGTILALLNQTSWVTTPSSSVADLNDVWIADAKDAWAVGDLGTILHWDGAKWTAFPLLGDGGTTATLRAVWGSGPKDVWSTGTNGTIAHYDGTNWNVVASGEAYSLNDVWGSSNKDIYAVGSSGIVLHYEGSAWTEQDAATSLTLNAVWGSDASHVWIAGEGGAILKRAP